MSGYGYLDTTWQTTQFNWNNWGTTPYIGDNWYNWSPSWGGYTSSTSGSSSSSSSDNDEPVGDYLEKQKAREEKIAQARIQGYAQKNMYENGLSKHTVVTTIGEGEQAQQVEVYADASGNPLKFKVENGQVVFDSKGVPVQDPNGQVVPVVDKKNIEQQKQKIEAGKKADGSSVQSMSAEEYEKKVPWYKRALRAAGNMVDGVWNMGKSLVGFDENGKWQPLKALKNAAIVAAGVALTVVCPAAGPVLLYAGLAMGAYQTGKGVYKACTAKTVEEIDAAWQDTGAGVATAAASAAGLRGMGNAAKASAAENAFNTAINAGKSEAVAAKYASMVSSKVSPWNPASMVRAQASKNVLTFNGGIPKWNSAQFKTNLNEVNPFRSKTKSDLAKTEADYKAWDVKTSAQTQPSEYEALMKRGIELEEKLKMLKNARMQELINSPTKWLSKSNRTAIKDHTGKGVFKSYYDNNMAGRQLKFWGGKTFKYGTKAMMWEYEAYKAMPTAGQVYASADRAFASQHYEYGSMYDMVGGLADNFLGTNSGAMCAPQAMDAAQTRQMIAAYDNEIAAVQKQMNDIDAQIRALC